MTCSIIISFFRLSIMSVMSCSAARIQSLEDDNTKLEALLDAARGTSDWRLLPEAQAQAQAVRQAQQRRAQEQIDKAASFFAARRQAF